MGRTLRILEVALDAPARPHSWAFPPGVTVIVGAVGGGKTSLLNLIKFGLGGKVPITTEVKEEARGVRLEVQAGERRMTLTRAFGRNVIAVGEDDLPERQFATERGTKHPWISDLLLEALGIPAVRVPKSRSGRSNELVSISFQDILTFCYLDQDQVDRSTMYDDDPFRGPKRAWTFEMLHGIVDDTVTSLHEQSLELAQRVSAGTAQLSTVEAFVRERGLAVEPQELSKRIEMLEGEEARLVALVIDERAEAERASQRAVSLVTSAESIVGDFELATADRRAVMLEVQGVRRAINQLERDRREALEGASARQTLEPLPFVACPRCEQALDARPVPDGHCHVCLQADLPAAGDELESELRTLDQQLAEARSLEGRLAAEERELRLLEERLSAALAQQRRQVQELVRKATAPHLSRIVEYEQGVGRARGERLALQEAATLARALDSERRELIEAGPAIAQLDDDAAQRLEDLAPARERVEELSEAFDEILRRLTLPWLKTAEVDRATYLPRVNGRTLKELSSGGMKATTNVAYYLAVLVTALRDRDVLTPSFLMLDSVRKDYGAGEKDLARAENIYDYLETLQQMRASPGALAGDFQLIVVDNDLPPAFEHKFNTIMIDPDRPLIRR